MNATVYVGSTKDPHKRLKQNIRGKTLPGVNIRMSYLKAVDNMKEHENMLLYNYHQNGIPLANYRKKNGSYVASNQKAIRGYVYVIQST